MDYLEELQKRAQDAGARFAMTEIEMTASLLARAAQSANPKERTQCLREAGTTLELASRLARSMPLADPDRDAIGRRVQELGGQLHQLLAIYPDTAARRARLRRFGQPPVIGGDASRKKTSKMRGIESGSD